MDEQDRGFLLVPMNVEVLLVGDLNDGVSWVDLSPHFQDVVDYSQPFGPDLVDPLEENRWQPKQGIHLHWALPRALAQASYGEETSGYAAIPNRWLVQRVLHRSGQAPIVHAWVIESDAVDASSETADREPPITIPNFNASALYSNLGRCVPLTVAANSAAASDPERLPEPLTALGWGNPVFSAYYPACKGVLGFHDPLSALELTLSASDEALHFDYMVVGWYSDRQKDPLYNCGPSQWTQKLAELGWSCGGADAPFPLMPPTRIACHGAVVNIKWQGKSRSYASSILTDADMDKYEVAVGNSSIEALTKLVVDSLHEGDSPIPGLDMLLEAFQHGILGSDYDPSRVAEELHLRRFATSSGGVEYTIQQKRQESMMPGAEAVVKVPPDLAQNLQQLNEAEATAEDIHRSLAADRQELYGEWCQWSQDYIDNAEAPSRRPIEALQQAICKKVKAQQQEKDRIESLKGALNQALTDRYPTLELAESALAPFYRPNNPAVLIQGPGLSAPQRDRLASGDEMLPCRLSVAPAQEGTTGQEKLPSLLEGISLDISNWTGIQVAATDVCPVELEYAVSDDAVGRLAQRLLTELLFLDAVNADLVAHQIVRQAYLSQKLVLDDTSDEFIGLVASIKAFMQSRLESANNEPAEHGFCFNGTAPYHLAINRWQGKNPWLPLLMVWQVEWTSEYVESETENDAWTPERWIFDRDHEEFRPTNAVDESITTAESTYLMGWTMLSAQSPWLLTQRLKEYRQNHADADINDLIALLAKTEVLSQSLGGFNEYLLQLESGLQLPPINPAFLYQRSRDAIDSVVDDLAEIDLLLPDREKPFLPLRAGALKLSRVWIVDAFGQTLKLDTEALAKPIRPRWLVDDHDPTRLLLPPRLVQPARLRFDWVWAAYGNPDEDNGIEDNGLDAIVKSPVCGWVVPNYLDKSLTIYDPLGKPLGALQKILRKPQDGGADNAYFWVPVPGDPAGVNFYQDLAAGRFNPVPDEDTEIPPNILPGPLADFVRFLLGASASTGSAFHTFVNELLGQKQGGKPEDDPLLSILVGRPLALVQASLKVEMDGPPVRPQSSDASGTQGSKTPPFTKIPFKVWLGDWFDDNDGLVGAFDDGMTTFYPTADASGNNLPGMEFGGVWPVTATDATTVTMLIDPQREVTARTGILPVKHVALPPAAAAAAAEIEATFFLAAPVLGISEAPHMPVPSDDFGEWSWAVRPQVTMWNQYSEIARASQQANFSPHPQRLTEGWLYLRMNPVVILAFYAKEDVAEVPAGAKVTLAWRVQGADTLTLALEGATEPIARWRRPDLAKEYGVTILKKTTYVLTAMDAHGNSRIKTLTIDIQSSTD